MPVQLERRTKDGFKNAKTPYKMSSLDKTFARKPKKKKSK